MKKKNWLYITTAATVLALAACSSNKETTATKTPLGHKQSSQLKQSMMQKLSKAEH